MIGLREMRSAAFCALAAGVVILGSACGGGDSATEIGSPGGPSEVIVYSPHGQEMLDEFEAAFEAAHPETDFIGRFIPTGKILGQMRIDRESPQFDVWWGGTSAFFTEAVNDGLLQPYAPSWADSIPDSWHAPGDEWYAQFVQLPAIMFNSNIYEAADMPKTWDELLDPKWADKIVIREPMNSGTMKTIYSGLVWMKGGGEGRPEAGYEFLKKLDAQTRSYLPNPQALYDRIAKSEEGYISLWNLTDIVFQAQANGYPFGFAVPSGPIPVSIDPIGIVADAPNPEGAKLFYEFATSKENNVKLAQEHYRILSRTDIAKDQLAEQMRSVDYEAMEVDLAEFDKRQAEWMNHWLENIRDPKK